jgi:hypothetical protein
MAGQQRKPGQAMTGMDIGGKIAEALGLPPETNLIQIRIGLNEVVEVIVRYYPDQSAMDALYQVFQRFHVIPADEYGLGKGPGFTVQMPIKHSVES